MAALTLMLTGVCVALVVVGAIAWLYLRQGEGTPGGLPASPQRSVPPPGVAAAPVDADEGEWAALWDVVMITDLTGGDHEMELELLETYIDSTQQELAKFHDALAQCNAKNAEIFSHSIKGASNYEIEKLCKQGSLEQVHAAIPLLEKAIADTCAIFMVHLAKNK